MIPLGSSDNEAEVMVDINTTPLVDVLLVLLVMLIITIPIQLHSVNIEMPGSNTPPPPVPPEIVRIDVTPGGAYLWNGRPLSEPARHVRPCRRRAGQRATPRADQDRAGGLGAVRALSAARGSQGSYSSAP